MSKRKRAYGAGSVFLRGNYYYLQTCVNGKTKWTSLKTSVKTEAESKAAKLRPVMDADTKEKVAVFVAEARKLRKVGSIAIADAFKCFQKSHDRPDSGQRQLNDYRSRWDRFCSFLKTKHPEIAHLGEIDKSTAQDYAAHLEILSRKDGKGKLSAKTFNDNIAMVSLIVRSLAQEAGLENNPFDSIRKKKTEIVHKKELTEAEAIHLLAVFDDASFCMPHKEEMRLCFHVGMFSGLRFADAVNLRFDQLTLDAGLIKLKPSKTKRTSGIEITVPLHPLLKAMLETAAAKRLPKQEYIMPHLVERFQSSKGALNRDAVRIFEAAGFTARIEEKSKDRLRAANVYGFHSFRSTFCSFAARKGVPLSVLAQITGDNIQTLQKYYIRIDDKTAAQTVAALPMLPQVPASSLDSLKSLRIEAHKLIDEANIQSLTAAILALGGKKDALAH